MMRILLTIVLCLSTSVLTAEENVAKQVLELSGVKGGLVVHLGSGDGKLTAALRADDSYLVQGLDTNPKQVAAARQHVRSLGIYGAVSIDTFDGKHLPYADNLVNLIQVSDADCQVSAKEIERVLAPRGVAVVPKGFKSTNSGLTVRTVDDRLVLQKPQPTTIDSWSHHLQGPDNNAVANDSEVGTPRRLKWKCGPLWSRSHEYLSSTSTIISADGRIFYVVDEGLPGITAKPIPERWVLIARDAFNGVLLWKKPLKQWGAAAWSSTALRGTPRTATSKFVAGGDRLFALIGEAGAVAVLDAATGEKLTEYADTEYAQSMRFLDGVLLVRAGKDAIVAIDVESGKQLWKDEGKIGEVFAASKARAYYVNGVKLICCDLKSGEKVWQKDDVVRPSHLLLKDNDLVMIVGKQVQAFEADSGKQRWSVPAQGRTAFSFATRNQSPSKKTAVFIAKNRIWTGLDSLDLATGKPMTTLDASDVHSPGHHPRCYPGKATENFLLTPNRGVEFISLTGEANTQNDWLRGSCTFGFLPCNGLLYVPPNPCFCYPGVKLTGFNAYAGPQVEVNRRETVRLEKGPAYKLEIGDAKSQPAEWPQYRQNGRRSGSVSATIDTTLKKQWSVKLGGRLTQPIIAAGKVFIVSKDTHTLHVLDEKSGKAAWTYTAGGRVDSPPTVQGKRVLFGSTDGWVYCLRASDGQLAWRFRAAPEDRRIVTFNQLESPWRVHGSVLIEKGIAYCTAGRSTNLDGGIYVYGLDPTTGKVLHETRIDSWARTREDAVDKPFVPGYHMEGAFSDILVSEGGSIYLGQYRMDLALKQQEVPYAPFTSEKPSGAMGAAELKDKPYTEGVGSQKKEESVQRNWQLGVWPKYSKEKKDKYGGSSMGDRKFGRHVFSTAGFLDDTYFNRTYWMYSETWPGFHIANRGAKTGQILSVDAKNTYAVQAYPIRNVQSPLFKPGQKGYLLFADDNENEPVIPEYTRGVPKGIGFTRKDPPRWHQWVPLRVRAMVAADNALFIAGPPDVLVEGDVMASFEGRQGGLLWAVSKVNGEKISQVKLDSPPVGDGMSASAGRLFLSTVDGRVVSFGGAP